MPANSAKKTVVQDLAQDSTDLGARVTQLEKWVKLRSGPEVGINVREIVFASAYQAALQELIRGRGDITNKPALLSSYVQNAAEVAKAALDVYDGERLTKMDIEKLLPEREKYSDDDEEET